MSEAVKKTILVVDDDEAIREAIVQDFDRRGYNTLSAENGKVALEVIRTGTIDLVVSDVEMPNGDGIELLDRTMSINSRRPLFIFMTASSVITPEEAYLKGAEALIKKPFERKVLIDTIEKAFSAHQRRQGQMKRKHIRIEKSLPIQIDHARISTPTEGLLTNLSRGGFFVTLEGSLPDAGSTIDFSINFSSGDKGPISGCAAVRWARKVRANELAPGVGVEFLDLTDHCWKDLNNLRS